MTTLKFEKISMPGANLGEKSKYPNLLNERAFICKVEDPWKYLDEDQGLYVGYSNHNYALPFTMIEEFDRDEGIKEFDAAIIENDYIKAVFMPGLGGRMWSLYDKVGKRDLVVNNPVFRPCNLAMRDAWLCGGVEWNCCGTPGHHPRTSDRIFASRYTAQDGTPALRLYDFERKSGCPFQMDIFLPNDSRNLYVRVRIVNNGDKVIPMYWYSNIAVEQSEGSRVIVPADKTYVNKLGLPVYMSDIPMIDGFDSSYPTNHIECTDHFFKMDDSQRKWEAYVDKDGNGLMYASTPFLKGRKFFVWGVSTGGDNWQKLLTNEEGAKHPYLEIQGGITYTQNGAKPFPPHTAWEWVEAYCPINMEREKVHGDYFEAVDTIEKWLDEYLPEEYLDNMLVETKKDALGDAEMLYYGEAWGTLDNELKAKLGKKTISANLDFGEMTDEQLIWSDFLRTGKLIEPDVKEAPKSFMIQKEWVDLLKKAVRGADAGNWYAWYNLGLGLYDQDLPDYAEDALRKSLELKESTWANHALGCLLLSQYNDEGLKYLRKAALDDPSNIGLVKETVRLTYTFEHYEETLDLYNHIDEAIAQRPLMQAYRALAEIHLGKYQEGKDKLDELAMAPIPDLREGDETITKGYIFAVQQLAAKDGKILEEKDVDVPVGMDYRMYPISK